MDKYYLTPLGWVVGAVLFLAADIVVDYVFLRLLEGIGLG